MKEQSYKRYSLLKTTLVVTGFYLFFGLLGFIISSAFPVSQVSNDWSKFFTWRSLLSQFISIAFSCFFYYFLINEYYRLLAARKDARAFATPTLLGIAALAIFYILHELIFTNKNIRFSVDGKTSQPITTGILILGQVVGTIFYLGISFLVAYLTSLRDEKKGKKLLEEQALQLEYEKSQANFNFLKAQINPHFLHNTLNFLYAKSLPYSEELSEGILTLSDIMRYALNESNAKHGKVPLNDELEHMGNVIKINQLRFSNELQVVFQKEGNTDNVQIIPFVLITLVENAFKHGDLTCAEHPITIHLQMNGHQLSFFCSNKKKTGLKELSTGIGLENIKKRLELTYGPDFSLDISDEPDFYTTKLKIDKL
ncbi:MAG: histidine kinase [Ginsengibacter sp.]